MCGPKRTVTQASVMDSVVGMLAGAIGPYGVSTVKSAPLVSPGGKTEGVDALPTGEVPLNKEDWDMVMSIAKMAEVKAIFREQMNEVTTEPRFSYVKGKRSVPLELSPLFVEIMKSHNIPALHDMYWMYYVIGLVVYTRGLVRTASGKIISRIIVPTERFVITVRLRASVRYYSFYWKNEAINGERPFPEYKTAYVRDTSVVVSEVDATAPRSDGRLNSVYSELRRQFEQLRNAELLREMAATAAVSCPYAIEHTPAKAETYLTQQQLQSAVPVLKKHFMSAPKNVNQEMETLVGNAEAVEILKGMYHEGVRSSMMDLERNTRETEGGTALDEGARQRLLGANAMLYEMRRAGATQIGSSFPQVPMEWNLKPMPQPDMLLDVEVLREQLLNTIRRAFGQQVNTERNSQGKSGALAESIHKDITLREQMINNQRSLMAPHFLHALKLSIADMLSADARYFVSMVHAFANGEENMNLPDEISRSQEDMLASVRDLFIDESPEEEQAALTALLTAKKSDLYKLVAAQNPTLRELTQGVSVYPQPPKPENTPVQKAAQELDSTLDLFQSRVFAEHERMLRGEGTGRVTMGKTVYKPKMGKKNEALGRDIPRAQRAGQEEKKKPKPQDDEGPRASAMLRALAGVPGSSRLGVVRKTPGPGRQMLNIAQHMLAMQKQAGLSVSFVTHADTRDKIITNLLSGVMTADDARKRIAASHGGSIVTQQASFSISEKDLALNLMFAETNGAAGILRLPGQGVVYSNGQPPPEPALPNLTSSTTNTQGASSSTTTTSTTSSSQDEKEKNKDDKKDTSKEDKEEKKRNKKKAEKSNDANALEASENKSSAAAKTKKRKREQGDTKPKRNTRSKGL